jgi:hypothetical protein
VTIGIGCVCVGFGNNGRHIPSGDGFSRTVVEEDQILRRSGWI